MLTLKTKVLVGFTFVIHAMFNNVFLNVLNVLHFYFLPTTLFILKSNKSLKQSLIYYDFQIKHSGKVIIFQVS